MISRRGIRGNRKSRRRGSKIKSRDRVVKGGGKA